MKKHHSPSLTQLLFFTLLTLQPGFLYGAAAEIAKNEPGFEQQRDRMVERQIRERGITAPRILQAVREVPRHRFVPPAIAAEAYRDRPLPIGYGQTISQPYIVALMTDALELQAGDKVLEIGTGSGYQAAILGELASEVYSIEIVPELAKIAGTRLREFGYENVHVKHGDGYKGWPEHAPFDAIILTAAPPEIPQPLIDQLKAGGRLIAPVGGFFQELILIRKTPGELKQEKIAPVRFVPMVPGDE